MLPSSRAHLGELSRKSTTSVFRSGCCSFTYSSPRRALARQLIAAHAVAEHERAQVGELDPLAPRARDLVAGVELRLERRDERAQPLGARDRRGAASRVGDRPRARTRPSGRGRGRQPCRPDSAPQRVAARPCSASVRSLARARAGATARARRRELEPAGSSSEQLEPRRAPRVAAQLELDRRPRRPRARARGRATTATRTRGSRAEAARREHEQRTAPPSAAELRPAEDEAASERGRRERGVGGERARR